MSPLAFRSEPLGANRWSSPPATQAWRCGDGRAITLRPARTGDIALARAFFANLTPQSHYRRFFSARRLHGAELEQLTRVDGDRHMALFATVLTGGAEQQVGAAHYARDLDSGGVELAVVVADQWQRLGLGERLLSTIADYASAAGAPRATGMILASNAPMLALARKLGLPLRSDPADPSVVQFSIALQ
jgi:acetyltransferase